MPVDRNYPSRSIYALIDPRDDTICYVGCAVDVEGRFKEHLKDKANTPKCRWLAELKRNGLHPRLEILETVNGFFKAFSREKYWIDKMLSAGIPLTNSIVTKGTFTKQDNAILSWRGTRLHYVRKKLRLTREEIIHCAGLASSAYNLAEAGRPTNCSVAEDILHAVNSFLQERGEPELSLADLGWIPN